MFLHSPHRSRSELRGPQIHGDPTWRSTAHCKGNSCLSWRLKASPDWRKDVGKERRFTIRDMKKEYHHTKTVWSESRSSIRRKLTKKSRETRDKGHGCEQDRIKQRQPAPRTCCHGPGHAILDTTRLYSLSLSLHPSPHGTRDKFVNHNKQFLERTVFSVHHIDWFLFLPRFRHCYGCQWSKKRWSTRFWPREQKDNPSDTAVKSQQHRFVPDTPGGNDLERRGDKDDEKPARPHTRPWISHVYSY